MISTFFRILGGCTVVVVAVLVNAALYGHMLKKKKTEENPEKSTED